MDFAWMSRGGMLLDGTGDIALTINDLQDLQSMVATRLKASLHGWKLYNIGANLQNIIGTINAAEIEAAIVKQVQSSLTAGLLPLGSFTTKVLVVGTLAMVFVYLSNSLIASTTLSLTQ